MIKVGIKNRQGILTHSRLFETQTEADNWVEYCQKKNIFGPSADEYTIEQKDITEEILQIKTNAEALRYLADTDWFIVRKMESGKEVPPDILEKRAKARLSIVNKPYALEKKE